MKTKWTYYRIKTNSLENWMKENDNNSIIDLISDNTTIPQEDIECWRAD